jgi:hypothetical protein
MGINAPEPINPRTDRFQKQMVATGDSFLGVRFLSAKSARTIGAQRYLGCTVRTQGFSPSLRFSPVLAWWLCFTPHPPLGFRSSELFPRRQPRYLSIFVALLSSRQCPSDSSKLESPVHPYTLSLDAPPVRVVWCRPKSVEIPGGTADFVPVLLLFSVLALQFSRSHDETRSHEPLRPDTPRRDSCCPARIISILSSPVWMA